MKKVLLAIFFGLVCYRGLAQVTITVPSGPDTVICNGAPLTMHAVNGGYIFNSVPTPSDDVCTSSYPIGFTFKYYGNNYTNFVISSNGYITFNTSAAGAFSAWSIGSGIPTNINVENSIMGVYADLYFPSGGNMSYGVAGVAPFRKLVVEFCDVALFSCTSNRASFQIILYETTNVIEVHTKRKDACTSWNSGSAIEGVENISATAGTAAPGRNYPGSWTVTTPDARRFTPDATFSSYTCSNIAYAPIPSQGATILWYAGSTYLTTASTVTVSPTVPTTYYAEAINCGGDTTRDTVVVTIGTGPAIASITAVAPSVCGLCDGSLTLHGLLPGTSDTINYTFNGTPQPTLVAVPDASGNVVIPGACAGTYDNFTAKVGYCTSSPYGPVVINPPPFTISSTSNTNPSICSFCDASIILHGLVPGTSDTIYYVKDGVAQPAVVQVVSATGTVTISGLCAGVYNGITATMNSCTTPAVGPIFVTDPAFNISTVTTVNPTVCGICNGSITIHGLIPGFYDTVNYSYNGVPQPPVVLLVSASGTVTLTGLCAGSYTGMTVTMNSCVATVPATVLSNPAFTISSTSSANPSVCGACDGSITLHGLIAGYTDTINFLKNGIPQAPVILTVTAGGTVTIPGLCAGVYTNITAKMNSCTTPGQGPVTLVNPAFGISDTSSVNATCSACDGTFTLYGLTPNQTITVNYNFNGVPQAAIVTTSNASGQVTISNLCPGAYSNITASLNTCTSNPWGTIIISAPPLIPIHVQNFTQPTECGLCNGTITIKGVPPGPIDTIYYSLNGFPQAPFLYSASPDSVVVLYNLCEGSYSNFFIKVGPCPTTTITSTTTLVAPPIVPGFTDVVHYGCLADVVNFTNVSTSTGPLWFVWNFGDGTTDTSVNPIHVYPSQGTYHVTLTISNHHCVDSFSRDIVLIHPIHAAFSSDTLVCQKNPVVFSNTSIGNPPTYVWSFGDGTFDTAATPTHLYNNVGTYTVQLIATNFVPCSDTTTEKIVVDSLSPISMTVTDTVFCQATYITLNSIYSHIGDTGITWSFGDGNNILNVNPVIYAYPSPGTFTIASTVGFRVCPSITTSRTVTVLPQPQINLGPDTTICEGTGLITLIDLINAGNPAATWVWNTGATGFEINVSAHGGYVSTVTVGNCHATDSVYISQDCFMAMPNIFTPNGDGLNDYFYPRQLLTSGLTEFKMDIYNRWGQLMFETKAVEGRGWDGKFNGQDQPEGVYIYVIDATFKDGTKEHHQGNITLLK